MCDFGLDGLSSGRSPDRLDALVWAVTALMFGAKGAAAGAGAVGVPPSLPLHKQSKGTRMYPEHPAWVEHQRKRWLKPNALVYWRPQYAHLASPEEASLLAEVLKPAARKRRRFAPMPSDFARAHEVREERQRRQEILRLKSDIAWLRFQRAMVLYAIQLDRKANFNPTQPRVPAANPDGGQWKEGEESGRTRSRRSLACKGPLVTIKVRRLKIRRHTREPTGNSPVEKRIHKKCRSLHEPSCTRTGQRTGGRVRSGFGSQFLDRSGCGSHRIIL